LPISPVKSPVDFTEIMMPMTKKSGITQRAHYSPQKVR
jgi:hypothetical protein